MTGMFTGSKGGTRPHGVPHVQLRNRPPIIDPDRGVMLSTTDAAAAQVCAASSSRAIAAPRDGGAIAAAGEDLVRALIQLNALLVPSLSVAASCSCVAS